MNEATAYIHAHAKELTEQNSQDDQLGQLSQETAALLRASAGMRLLQPKSHGGHEAHPHDFFEWVRTVARYNPSAGWVAGVVGVHPWEVAFLDAKLQDEIYRENPDTWIASPYAPMGKAVVDGEGFRLTGKWQYSTGTDHCDWVVLGGMVVDENGRPGKPPEVRHFFLPRGDYEIVQDSWHVMGLSGTGSKDIIVEDMFIPVYRSILHNGLAEGDYNDRQAGNDLYQIPFGCMFSAAIASATLGMAQGAVDQYRNYLESRVSVSGVVGKTDPYQLEALAEVEADLSAGIAHIDSMISTWLDQVNQHTPITKGQRLDFRRNQVRAVQRVLFGVDKLFSRAGSAGIWSTRPLEQRWRDVRTASTHICNTIETIYGASVSYSLGDETANTAMY